MEKFTSILERAIILKGEKELKSSLPENRTIKKLCQLSDADCLAAMTKKIFQSGFIWRVVENKWPGFEEVFWSFDPNKLTLASDEQIERMAQDTRIIRNFTKVKSVRENAYFVKSIAKKHQSFGQFLAEWPVTEITQLWLYLKKNGTRLGGNSGPYFLRAVGKDTFLLTQDVTNYLIAQNIVSKIPSSQRDLKAVQSAFNEWHDQSGKPFSHISKIIACGQA